MKIKPPLNRDRRRLWIAVLVIVGSMAATALYIFITSQNIPFDSALWAQRDSAEHGSDLRMRMIKDLQNNILEHGMSQRDVELLLGRADKGMLFDKFDMAYRVGQGPTSSSVTRSGSVLTVGGRELWLGLRFNRKNQLVDWCLVMQ